MNHEEFFEYLKENFTLSPDAYILIDNILEYVSWSYYDSEIQYDLLRQLLYGIGLEDEEIEQINL